MKAPSEYTPTMANDNQTALMISIQRKKDTLKYWEDKYLETRELNDRTSVEIFRTSGLLIECYKKEIAEDEKLLPTVIQTQK